jgi:hypothetical protein
MDADSHRSSPYGFGQCLLADSQSSQHESSLFFSLGRGVAALKPQLGM